MAAERIIYPETDANEHRSTGTRNAPSRDPHPACEAKIGRRYRKTGMNDTGDPHVTQGLQTQSTLGINETTTGLKEPLTAPVTTVKECPASVKPADGVQSDDHPKSNVDEANAAKGCDEEKPAIALTPEVIVEYAHVANVTPFQDQHGNVFAWIPVEEGENKHSECLRIRSNFFRSRLLQVINSRTSSTPKMAVVKQAIEFLELEAYRGPKLDLANRRTTVDGETFIDLGDDQWRMVRVRPHGWTVEPQDKARFFRPQHMRELPEPVAGGTLDVLFNFVPTESDGERLLLTTWLLGGLYAAIPNPILLIVGQQGSAKTTRSRRLRSLLDPSVTPVLGDLEMSNLFMTFQHHAVPCFENVSHFNRGVADMFCRAVTGNGVERRKLYTDGDQVLYSFRRPIIINGIDTPSTRPDFLDRCVVYSCRRMDRFIPLDELDREFEAARPRLLGAMLDLLVRTLRALHSTPPATEFRMADFARFGRAVATALGQEPTAFDVAYRMNIDQQNFEILEAAPMGRVLEKFAIKYASKEPWQGTAEQLLDRLREVAYVASDKDGRDDLPKSSRWLSSRLAELAPAMATRQVGIRKLPRTNAARLWEITTVVKPDPNAEPDDIFDVLSQLEEPENPKN